MTSIARTVARIKDDPHALKPQHIVHACQRAGHHWRDRELNPIITLRAFLLQVLHGNVACRAVRHLAGFTVSTQAYNQARARLPLEAFGYLVSILIASTRVVDDDAGHWLGHRVFLIDGTGVSMPDTAALQKVFGQPTGQKPGCGFPVMHLLLLFDAATGTIRDLVPNHYRTHDMADAAKVHPSLREGDVLLADRAFCSFAHLALLWMQQIHAVFRMHQRTICSFSRGRRQRSRSSRRYRRKQPASRLIRRLGHEDQVVEYRKPAQRPRWMSKEQFAQLPPTLQLRELRYRMSRRGYRTKVVTLVTTLLDSRKYPKSKLIEIYEQRWQAEINLRHLKVTLGMDVLRCKDEEGVMKELWMYVMAYNLVRLTMLEAAGRQQVDAGRISFVDVLEALRLKLSQLARSCRPEAVAIAIVNPSRPGRHEPRVVKRRRDHYTVMTKPRHVLRKALGIRKVRA